ncbi:hypothetical protein [Streptomyces sp. BBFR102]|uniref:hypothetical protein n=1 Tax=Streptomyces sp. BBFR102 TaxID=3448171 RepID=UPI003F52C28E
MAYADAAINKGGQSGPTATCFWREQGLAPLTLEAFGRAAGSRRLWPPAPQQAPAAAGL